jgi:hypothetical protein
MKLISEKVSYNIEKNDLTIVILGRVERFKETLLLVWLLAWTFCGAAFLYALYYEPTKEMKLALFVMLMFWIYFEIKIGRTFLFRKFGSELIRITDGKLSIKQGIKGYGNADEYFIDNISSFGIIERSEKSFFGFIEKSFWFLGYETIGFEHKNKMVKFAMQLNQQEAAKVVGLIQQKLKK